MNKKKLKQKRKKNPRQRRRKTRGDRLEAAERAMQQQQQSSQQRDSEEKNKDWENDSWKTIPRDEKSWSMYRNTADIWSESKHQSSNKGSDLEGRYTAVNGRRRGDSQDQPRNSDCESREKRDRKIESSRKSDYDQPRGRQEIERNNRYTNGDDRPRETRRSHEDRRENTKRERDIEESEEEEREMNNEEEETYGTNDYSEKFDNKKYYDDRTDDRESNRYRTNERENCKYENEKSESVTSSDSEGNSTITIPETGRKVEHIAQKLEQTAQKYAREHSPPKFTERRREEYTKSLDRSEKPPSYEKYERETRSVQPRERFERERYQEKNHQQNYERERTFEKNPDRKRNAERSSNRRFERPRPPFEDAPERPRERPYRERRYSEKEEIYGETGRFSHSPATLEKDRGYESNFETKLERSKVIEKVQVSYRRNDPLDHKREITNTRSPERNDTNNNTLKNERKNLPRQSTALGHLAQTGRAFDVDMKSPKLIKRTKSFWRFRRDSEVLEGMALWQHRSLVDIPKMIKRESKESKIKDDSEVSRKSSPENVSGSVHSLDKESRSSDNTITNDHSPRNHREEPKPAERSLVPDKSDYFDDFPTPAERPKAVERSEYRIQREERSYFVGNVSRKAILEKERKRSLEAKRNMVVAELKENNEAKKGEHRSKSYGDDDDGLMQNFSETEASDEESTYSCIVVKEQAEKTLLPRTKLRRDSDRERDKNTCGPWYDLWGVDASVNNKKKKK